MDRLVATGVPASALPQLRSVVEAANVDGGTTITHLLNMTFQAKVGIPFSQHHGIDAPMGTVARGATFPQRFMFERERATQGRVALETSFIPRK